MILTNGENFRKVEKPSLTALGDLGWIDPFIKEYNIRFDFPAFKESSGNMIH